MTPESSLLGRNLDEYRLDTLLGQGGMARVYKALDVRLKRLAAVKVIDTPFRGNNDYSARFEREAQAIAQLEHPHIVRVYRYGDNNGLLYIAMQYVAGSDLQKVMESYEQQGEFMPLPEVVKVVDEVNQALDYAHQQGVIHRDIKPSNIMFTPQGHTILTDFGLALLSEAGTRGEVFGTPHYIAPEQAISSAGVVSQSDLYAVGVILYRLLTGKLPFYGEDALDIAMKHMTEAPPLPRQFRPDLAPALEQVVLKSLAKEPVDRYATGAEFTQALQAAVQETPPAAPPSARLSLIDKVMLTQNEPLNLPAASPTPPPFMPPVVDVPPPAYQPPPLAYTPPPSYEVVNEPEPTAYGYTPTPAASVYAEEPEAESITPPPAAGMPTWLPLAMGVGFGLLAFAVIAWLFSGGGAAEVTATPTVPSAEVVVVEETAASTSTVESVAETAVPETTEPAPTEAPLIAPVSGPPYTYFFPIVVRN